MLLQLFFLVSRLTSGAEVYCDELKRQFNDSQEEIMRRLAANPKQEDWETYVKPILQEGGVPFKDGAIYNETFNRWFYRLVQLEHGLCFHAERYQLEAPNGRRYNALQFAGTVDLAHDLDLLRQAVGAPKLSLYGLSYGTSVASVYSKIYPEHTLRVVMDGVVDPTPETAVRSDAFAKGIESVWQGLISDCEGSLIRGLPKEKLCPAAPQTSSKLMQILRGPDQTSAGLLLRLIQQTTFRQMDWAPYVMACIQQLTSGTNVTGCSMGMDLSKQKEAQQLKSQESEVPSDRFHLAIQAVVMGTDTAGRLNEEEFMDWFRKAKAGGLRARDALTPTCASFSRKFICMVCSK